VGFRRAAKIARSSGFTGIQVHSAHGYLLSQFLSPITNRTRRTSGVVSLENRSRLLMAVSIREIRREVGRSEYPISVKLNSSDFQRGGLSEEESLEVVKMLDKAKIDLLEISGGTYEKTAFFLLNEEHKMKASTKAREAYFIDFAKKIRAVSSLPLMVTGGFRSFEFCNKVIEDGELDLIGMGRPFITNLEDISGFLEGNIPMLENLILRTGIKQFEDASEGGFYAAQLIRLSKGKKFNKNMGPLWSSNFLILHELKKTLLRKL
jgi:2,4-dienoyl-CoA reductase-like NADH-dependent reductase (Old Yellow Enzyme family)